jgi:ribonuclease BN (tRNA processing enzyme)
VLKAWEIDIDVRTINQHSANGFKVNAHEIAPGVIYRDHNVAVTAFPARHEALADAFSFRFDTPDRAIVISGDTTPTPVLIEHSRGCDVLVHEAYSMASFHRAPPRWQDYRRSAHTSSTELAEIANAVKPGLLVLYHRSNAGGDPTNLERDEVVVEEIRQAYKGKVVQGHDLDIF